MRSIVYAGGLAYGRWVSIVELCEAVRMLKNNGLNAMVTVFASGIPKEAMNKLQEIDNLQIHPAPSHEELPSYLKGADILYLPETFNAEIANSFRLSISTKAHLYMMSERPVLVYSPPATGIMNYAITDHWAFTVQEQNVIKLSQGLLKLFTDPVHCKKLIDTGLEVVARNHDEKKIRARFLYILSQNAV